MAEIASAYLSILPSFKGGATGITKQVQGPLTASGTSLGKTFGRLFARGFALVGVVGAGALLKGSIEEAREAQKVSATTEAIIKSTGGAAGITAEQVEKMAGRLSAVTGIDDEAIQSGENLLLTFKNVKNYVDGEFVGVFDRATASAIDLSAAGFGSIESASKVMGKALNDPIKGVTALSRAGVTFSDQQKKQIERFVKTGQVAKAQNLILKEVESQVGGVAKAQATAGDKARVAFDNLKETIGTALLPVIDRLATVFTEKVAPVITTFIEQLSTGEGVGGKVAATFGFLGDVLGTVFGFIKENKAVSAAFIGTILAIVGATAAWNAVLAANPIGLVVIAIAALVAGLVYAYQHSERFKNIVDAVFGFIAKYVPKVVGAVVGFVKSHWKLLVVLIGGPVALVALLVAKHFGTIENIAGNVAKFVVGTVKQYIEFVKGVAKAVGAVVQFFKQMPVKIKGFLKALPADLKRIGVNIIDGLVKGLSSVAHKVTDFVEDLVGKIPKKIRSLMGISSPSKVTTYLGEMIGEGLARGVEKGGKKAEEKLQKLLDKLKSQLDSALSDFASLKDSVSGAFTGDLFGAETAGDFVSNLLGTKGQLTALKAAFKKLLGYGLKPEFLSQLFQSGNGGLILDLAAGTKAQATQANALFGDVTSLSTSLGTSVADVKFGDKLDGIRQEIKELRKDQKGNADRTGFAVGREINLAGRSGSRRGRVAA